MFKNDDRQFHSRRTGIALALLAVFLVVPQIAGAQETITTDSGLSYIDTKPGNGPAAKAGQKAVVHYIGWLYVNGVKGAEFDSSRVRDQTFTFPLGAGRVIRGWDEGIAGMRKGGQRTLIIPPDLAYGPAGAGGVIPPNATLLFEVELIEIR